MAIRLISNHVLRATGALAICAVSTAAPSAARAADGPANTVAGTSAGFAGESGPANQAKLSGPLGAVFASDGSILIADSANHRVRLVSPTGTITTIAQVVAQNQQQAGPPPPAQLSGIPAGVAYDNAGRPLVSDQTGSFIGRITVGAPLNVANSVTVIAGTRGASGFSGDGGPANQAKLNAPAGIAVGSDGSLLIADAGNNRIRRVSPSGVITTVAGTGAASFSGDGGQATAAALNHPTDVAVDSTGALLIADTGNNRIRRVATDGTISTLAGNGAASFGGDGLPAAAAGLSHPASVTPLASGDVVVADTGNNRLRRITPLGTIFTIAGNGNAGLGGDGGPASAAQFSAPASVTATSTGGFIVADTGNSRIRTLESDGVLPGPIPGRTMKISRTSGFVQATIAGQTAKALREPDLVLLGTRADASVGEVQVETAAPGGGVRTAVVSQGQFSIEQPNGPIETDFHLTASLSGCRKSEGGLTGTGARATKKKKKGRRTRKIFVKADGGHRTVGRYADAVVRGTEWTVQDYCNSTRVSVQQGIVAVRDHAKHQTVIVHSGHRYIARKPAHRSAR